MKHHAVGAQTEHRGLTGLHKGVADLSREYAAKKAGIKCKETAHWRQVRSTEGLHVRPATGAGPGHDLGSSVAFHVHGRSREPLAAWHCRQAASGPRHPT